MMGASTIDSHSAGSLPWRNASLIPGSLPQARWPVAESTRVMTMPGGGRNGGGRHEGGGRRRADRFDNDVRQDGERDARAGKPDRARVVGADPHAHDEAGRVADEPRVAQAVGRAGLAGGALLQAPARARAAG